MGEKKKASCQFLLSGFIIRITVETQNYQLWTQLELLVSAVYRMERESLSQNGLQLMCKTRDTKMIF